MCRTSIDSYAEFRHCAAGSQRRTFSEGRRRSRQPVECHKPRQSPAPGFGEKYWSLSGFPSHSLESGGGAFLTVIFGQILAYSAFSDSHFSSPGSLSALMASTGHSGSQTPQSMQFVRVDDEHVLALVEAVHGAHFDAVHGFAANAAIVDDVRQLSVLSADRSGELIHGVRYRGARSLAENGRRGDLRPLTGSRRRTVGIQGPRSSRLLDCGTSLDRGTRSPGKHRSADAPHVRLQWSALCAACDASRLALSRRTSPRRAPELRTDHAQALSYLCSSVAD